MLITEIIIKREAASDGSPIVGCRVRTDGEGENEFGCSLPWREGEMTPTFVANELRACAAAIEKMDAPKAEAA